MTGRFQNFIPWILKWETEYSGDGSVRTEHDPDDNGGATRYGIDQRSHPHEDIEHLTKERATEIYWEEWSDAGCDTMPPKTGECYFNCAVNCGASRAKQFMKESNGTSSLFLNAQAAFYNRLAAARPKSQKYLKGWLNRLNDLRTFLGL